MFWDRIVSKRSFSVTDLKKKKNWAEANCSAHSCNVVSASKVTEQFYPRLHRTLIECGSDSRKCEGNADDPSRVIFPRILFPFVHKAAAYAFMDNSSFLRQGDIIGGEQSHTSIDSAAQLLLRYFEWLVGHRSFLSAF